MTNVSYENHVQYILKLRIYDDFIFSNEKVCKNLSKVFMIIGNNCSNCDNLDFETKCHSTKIYFVQKILQKLLISQKKIYDDLYESRNIKRHDCLKSCD